MKKTMKKVLALLLSFVMVIGILPISAFAVETGGKITFTTTFTNEMTIGSTFTVTATLSENPGIASFANSLKWNDKVVEFTGFERKTTGNKKPITEVFADDSVSASDETGVFAVSLDYDNETNGALYTAKFKIIAEEGELGLGLTTTEFGQKFTFANVSGTDIMPVLDFSAISGLTVGGKSVGAEVPEELADLGVTAMTTDNGAVLEYTLMSELLSVDSGWGSQEAPYYLVTIPEGAENVYVTFNMALQCNTLKNEQGEIEYLPSTTYGQVYEYEGEVMYNEGGGTSCVPYHDQESNIAVIPMVMDIMDWNGNSTGQFSVLRTEEEGYEDLGCYYDPEYEGYYYNVVGLQSDVGDKPVIAFFAFEYGEETPEEEVYNIKIDENIVGGTVTAKNEDGDVINQAKAGDTVMLDYEAEEGYTFSGFTYVNEDTNQETECANGAFNMPAANVTIKAAFRETHIHAYNKEVAADKFLKDAATCKSGAVYYKSCECGEFVTTAETFVSGDTVAHKYENGQCKWCQLKEVVGYHFATSADVSADNNGTAVVHVKITGHSNPSITTYNAYDLTLTYDNTKLEFVSGVGADSGDQIKIEKKGSNQIQIVGVGDAKGFDVEVATLTFKTIAEGAANVTIDKVQVSDKEEAVTEDIPVATPKHDEEDTDADETPDVSVIVVPYSVTKPGFISGEGKVLHGASYTFSYTDTTNYTYSDLVVKVGGTVVTPTEANGVYTIANVTGAVEITATQTPNSYAVTKPTNVSGPVTATYGEDYIFTITASEGKIIDSVTVTLTEGGQEVPYVWDQENDRNIISGKNIVGAFTITVTEVDAQRQTTVHFVGVDSTEIVGGANQTATVGQAFTFELNEDAENYTYTAKVGETVLTVDENGVYTIPGTLVVADSVTVTIVKTEIKKLAVDVAEYISLNGKVMFLVTAKWGEKVLAYGEDTMYYSGRYTVTGETEAGAYCWLVLSTEEMNTADQVKAAAEAAIKEAAEGAEPTAVEYDYDINGTTKVDVNDAQLAYDMYNASYMEFTDNLPIWKFLEADIAQGDSAKKLDVNDVAAIISYIVTGANA